MTDSVVVEGYARLRDGKKWKTRWLVLRKPSPVADCLVLLVFKDKSEKAQGNRERACVTLEEIFGLETGQCYEGVTFTLAVLCLNQCALLGFDTKEALLAWDARLRYSLGEVHRFSVGILPGTKLESGPATLHLCNNLLALTRDIPPVIIGHWNLPDLRRYGPVPNGFVFEGGTRCGFWAGVFLLTSAESEQISFLFDCVVRGISPTRGPFGLRPVLPDPSVNPVHSEEKLNHDAQELEKRLSMLSHRNSTISSTYCPSAGGDDRSISGSSDTSDTSQSDCSTGSRLVIWSDPATSENSGQLGPKLPQDGTEKLSVNQGGGNRPVVKVSRQLQEIGRQSSSDSGIATGSHSSYSGSFSSYTGSLDISPAEDFGSVFSLPPHLAQDLRPCTCPTAPGHEYQVPNSLRYLYDNPRSRLHVDAMSITLQVDEPSCLSEDTADTSAPPAEASKGEDSSASTSEGQSQTAERLSVTEDSEESKKTKVVPSSGSQHPDSCHICSSLTTVSKTILAICSTCGGYKTSLCIPPSGPATQSVPDQNVKPLCGSITGSDGLTAKRTVETCASHESGSITSTERMVKTCEDSLLPKKGRDKLVSLLADLLGYPRAERKLEAHTNTLNCYESMSPVFGNVLKTCKSNSQHDRAAVTYENCLKCQGEHCQPPPRLLPLVTLGSRSLFSSATFQPSAALLKTSQEPAAANEQALHQTQRGHGSQSEDGPCHCEETNGRALTSEDKWLSGRDERRRADGAYEVMEGRALEKNSEGEEKNKYELMGSCGQQRFLQETEGVPDRLRSEAVTYVNIPVSPTSKKQLNYMELGLQEPGPGSRGSSAHLPAQRKCSTKYAQIDITATETAHKVGTQHALGRQEGLHTLELRRKATPH